MEQEFVEHQPHLPGFIPKLPIKDLSEDLTDQELCEVLVDRLSQETNQVLPIDIGAVAEFCGVVKTSKVSKLRAQGFLHAISETDYYHMELLAEDDPGEKRFTMAHELGHLFLKALGRPWTTPSLGLLDSPAETFCNRFARATLAPRSLLEPEVKILNHVHQEALWQDHSDWAPSSKALTSELWQLLSKTELPAPYLAQRLAEDLGLSENTLMSIVMGPKREKRYPRARIQKNPDCVYWRNLPFELYHPSLELEVGETRGEDLVSAINRHLAVEIYNRQLKHLEDRQESCIIERTIPLGVKETERPGWLDIFEAKIKGLLICEEGTPDYFLAILKFDQTGTVKGSSERDFPYRHFYQQVVKLLPNHYSPSEGRYVFE